MREYLYPLEVKYRKSRPVVLIPDEIGADSLVEKSFLTKSEDWAYEQELRATEHEKGHGIWEYQQKEVLASITLGARMSADERQELFNIFDDLKSQMPHLKINQAELSTKTYSVRINELKS